MDLEQLPAVLRMLAQIEALSYDPDAAELVHDGSQLALTLQPIIMAQAMQAEPSVHSGLAAISLMALMQQVGEESNRFHALSEKTLSQLPVHALTRAEIDGLNANAGEAICAVCHENYEVGKQVLELPCGHQFCSGCGKQWLRRNCTCPICRTEVPDEERGKDGGWHSEDLFPYRYPQGSSLTAVRRVRQAHQRGIELWPPVDDMERIAEGHSNWQSLQDSDHNPPDQLGSALSEQNREGLEAVDSTSSSGFNVWRSHLFNDGARQQPAVEGRRSEPTQAEEATSSTLVAAQAARRSLAFSQSQRDTSASMQADEIHCVDGSEVPTPQTSPSSRTSVSGERNLPIARQQSSITTSTNSHRGMVGRMARAQHGHGPWHVDQEAEEARRDLLSAIAAAHPNALEQPLPPTGDARRTNIPTGQSAPLPLTSRALRASSRSDHSSASAPSTLSQRSSAGNARTAGTVSAATSSGSRITRPR